jgi:hypothetical protein
MISDRAIAGLSGIKVGSRVSNGDGEARFGIIILELEPIQSPICPKYLGEPHQIALPHYTTSSMGDHTSSISIVQTAKK